MSFAGCLDDASFGPAVRGCRDDFDFTLKFEKILLDLIPASVFVAASLPRLFYLLRRPVVVKGSFFSLLKLLAIGSYAALQIALLALAASKSTRLRDLFISSAAVNVLSSMCMLTLSHLEHARSLRPSILLSSYLFLTTLFDTAQARTLWLASTTRDELTITRLATAAVALKAAIMLLESLQKSRWAILDLKERSPEEMTGIAGLGAYLWLNRLFLAGYRKVLCMDDLYPLDSKMAGEALGDRLASAAAGSEFRGRRFALAGALAKTLAVALLTPVGPRIALVGFTFCQPFLINSTLSFLQEPKGERDPNVGYGLIGATILVYAGKTLSEALYWYFHERCLWMIRGALASAIYKKTTEAKINVVDDTAAITLMSTDVETMRRGMLMFHEFWANIFEISIASFLLYRSLGAAFSAPIILIIACAAVAAGIATFTGQRQKDWMDKIQKRVGTTASMIANMKSLKISGLALPMQNIMQGLRLEEIRVGRRFRMVLCWSFALAWVPFFISPVITFAWTSNTLGVTTMFTSYSYLLLLCNPLTNLFPSVPLVLSAAACLGRIQAFLGNEPRQDYRQPPGGGSSSEKEGPNQVRPTAVPGHTEKSPLLSISKGSFGWNKEAMSLSNINVAIPASQLTIVVGTIASGKSTLCKALLGEAPVFEGQITLGPQSRRIGYCSQNPFLSNATIKRNIIGFSPLNKGRYDEVIEATMLSIDLLTFPQGDNTKVGSNGITLSGGQKQRVSLARALYLETECFLFDDVLSGLDADTEELVFRRVFGPDGLIKRRGATAVLCTHSVRHITSADHIIALGADGTVIEQGTFEHLVANQNYVHSLGVKAKSDNASSPSSSTTPVGEDDSTAETLLRAKTTTESQPPAQPSNVQEDMARMNGDWTIYRHYYRSIGFWTTFAVITTSIASGFFYNFQSIWINLWSAGVTAQPPAHGTAHYLGLFAMMQVLGLLTLFLCVLIGFRWMIARSGAALHQQALHTVLHAPLRFFTTTDNGVVTNLFSQDMTLIDNELPMSALSMILDLAICIGMAAVVATSSPYLAISYPFLGAVLFVVQKFYLRTSRQLRLLDLEAKSPLYTHFIDTIKGLATFRAFGWIPASIAANNALVDNSQRPAYLLAMIQRWLAFALNVVVSVLAIVVVTLSTQLKLGGNAGFTGASMVTLMTLGPTLTGLIRCYTALETSLGAVNRLKTFSETVRPEGGDGEDVVPDERWPSGGEIEIRDVSATYSDTSGPPEDAEGSDVSSPPAVFALRDVTLTIPAGQKVAVCGRTGSGKSSLVLLLLRLLDPSSGDVTVDGVPLRGVDRATLRQRLVAIPQDAVFLPEGSSFRANLDPLGVATEEECRAVLEAVGLLGFVEGRGGLAAGLGPETLSGGQRQLFSLARALVRRRRRRRMRLQNPGGKGEGGLLLLDEVSSSVDIDTERAMHAVIQREFEGCTIVMVSHRLEMVMDFDAVVVMDKGSVVETGAPKVLVDTEGSRFKGLWEVSRTQREQYDADMER